MKLIKEKSIQSTLTMKELKVKGKDFAYKDPNAKIRVYGKINCRICTLAIEKLLKKNKSFVYLSVDSWNKLQLESLANNSRMNTLPIIYYNNILIGSFEDLEKWLEIKRD